MPPSFQIFVIYHKVLYAKCYEKLPPELFQYLTFVAVNPAIEKIYPPSNFSLIKEWELPLYNPRYQQKGYNENSVLFHLYLNGILKKYDYVGFCQYDMIFEDFTPLLAALKPSTYIGTEIRGNTHWNFCFGGTELKTLDIMEKSFALTFERELGRDRIYPLFNTYIVPSADFQKIVGWALQVDSLLVSWLTERPLDTIPYLIGSVFERVFAMGVGELLQRSETVWNIEHPGELKQHS
jgi:hypothetical protein